ncbi:DNA topoisomerase IV subunit A [Burkholderia multivorans]|uniref:DNA topoisomerase IV subunit A n=1 Tax=Burkholderia multivorans TaxID=87883 RepID=UPI001C24E3D9|nr:DNA topoisomerase IV subunit A [Burkholderia multivorans]MBU9200269.1 DNA topoisomerase IV subunit A [Burkholderia multivorans]MDN8078604.1 DNA topoisomerase IV subunit A [Burkholderia multivorans]
MSEVLEQTESPDSVDISQYAENAYLAYAMSVVMGRALPMLPDGQKPVQRRILYAMHRMGLTDKSKPVKCARFVGDIIGKYHPHGDSSVYEAAVRMAQDFSLRYPIVDGQGNFGSRDGDSAAAMRYTEARLTPIAELLLGELDQGTVDFVPNYDGSLQEPTLLPARLPMLLLNGVSGIAVGMATEIPSHNLTEVSLACEHLIRHPDATLADILALMPGPDFPGGAQVISSAEELTKAYTSGRGPIRTRARWVVEPLARGQWQIAITELPPKTSTAAVMAEIEELTNPQVKASKKTLTQDQTNLKALVLSMVDKISDDSDGEHPVRLVIEPRSSRLSPDEVMQVLLAHTSLESNFPLNLVTIGQDGKPGQKGLLPVLKEWVAFRFETVTRRTKHRLDQVHARMHILNGRLTVFLHLDEVIRIIRETDDPKAELMSRFSLSDVQATDILEIRLRQLANLERVKIEGELAELQKEETFLQGLLDNRAAMTKQILKEMAEDRKKYGDARRTLIESAERITTSSVVAASDDPVTLIISRQGWLRARTGHKVDLSALTWKAGDEALAIIETRSAQTVAFLDNTGRVYNVSASLFPTGRGDGSPLSSFAEIGANKLEHAFVLDTSAHYLLANSGGYGFLCPGAELVTSKKAGKAVMSLEAGEAILPPVAVSALDQGGELAVGASSGKVLLFPLADLKQMAKGRGMQLITLNGKDTVTAACAFERPVTELQVTTTPSARKKLTQVTLTGTSLDAHRGKRARAGAALPDKAVAKALQATLGEAVRQQPGQPLEPVADAAPPQEHSDYGDSELI